MYCLRDCGIEISEPAERNKSVVLEENLAGKFLVIKKRGQQNNATLS